MAAPELTAPATEVGPLLKTQYGRARKKGEMRVPEGAYYDDARDRLVRPKGSRRREKGRR